jgi:hypothetical protein
MDPLTSAVINALGVGGPLGLVLGLAVKVLWSQLRELRVHYEGDPSRPEVTGKFDSLRKEYETKLTKEREDYAQEIKRLHAEQKEMLLDINSTFRALLSQDNGDED